MNKTNNTKLRPQEDSPVKEFLKDSVGLLLLAVLKIIKIYKRVVFCPFHPRIGHISHHVEVFLRRLESGNYFDKKNYYIGVGNKHCNQQLVKMYKRVFPVIENKYLAKLAWLPKIWDSEFFCQIPHPLGKYYEFNNLPPVLSFTGEEEERGKRLLAQMGIGEKDWFICFHSRDSAFNAQDKFFTTQGSYASTNYRDSDVKNYLKAAEYIAEQGGFAIRMGSIVAGPLPNDRHPRIIDYAADFRSDFMDIYLPAHCKFFLGNTSGMFVVSTSFSVPVIEANVVPLCEGPFIKGDLFIPKKLYSKDKKRFLTFKEIFDSFNPDDLSPFCKAETYRKRNLEVIENTANEILAVTKEMYKQLTGNLIYSEEDEFLQDSFRSKIHPNLPIHGIPARIGTDFLRENRALLD